MHDIVYKYNVMCNTQQRCQEKERVDGLEREREREREREGGREGGRGRGREREGGREREPYLEAYTF